MLPSACLLTAFTLFSAVRVTHAQTECTIQNQAFQAGEKVVYKVIYNWNSLWLNAGEVSFTVKDAVYGDRKAYHILGYGSTYKSYDWFYKVRDSYESYLDQQTMKPLKFIRNVYEGGYTIYNNVTFDHAEQKATSTNGVYDVPACIQDVLSAIYYSRNIDFSKYQVDDTIPVNLFLDDSVYHIYLRYLGKEVVRNKLGSFNCIKFRPLLIQGTIFKGGEGMTVWVSDDRNKIPVLIESPIVVGSIRAEIYKYEGLRHPLTARFASD